MIFQHYKPSFGTNYILCKFNYAPGNNKDIFLFIFLLQKLRFIIIETLYLFNGRNNYCFIVIYIPHSYCLHTIISFAIFRAMYQNSFIFISFYGALAYYLLFFKPQFHFL